MSNIEQHNIYLHSELNNIVRGKCLCQVNIVSQQNIGYPRVTDN